MNVLYYPMDSATRSVSTPMDLTTVTAEMDIDYMEPLSAMVTAIISFSYITSHGGTLIQQCSLFRGYT